MRTCLFAYTAPGSAMPPYISINRDAEKCLVAVTVRDYNGSQAEIVVTDDFCAIMAHELLANLRKALDASPVSPGRDCSSNTITSTTQESLRVPYQR